jgi:hypothetical protein
MARPRAIYASIPQNEVGVPNWDNVTGVIPVECNCPFPHWPDLDWIGDTLDENGPAEYDLEHPKYLWSHPLVQDPVGGESHVFIRKWVVGQPGQPFDYQTLPPDNLLLVITHAADNQYALALTVGDAKSEATQSPMGANVNIPNSESAWRNCKTYLYHLDLSKTASGANVELITEAINHPQPGGTSATNPAMFTWVMYIYNCP